MRAKVQLADTQIRIGVVGAGAGAGGNKNKKNKKEKADEAHIKALPSREEESANKEEGRADRMEGWRIFLKYFSSKGRRAEVRQRKVQMSEGANDARRWIGGYWI